MQDSMLSPTNIEIDSARLRPAHPIFFGLFANEPLVVPRIAKSQVIPTRAGPLRHHVRFARGLFLVTNPILSFGEWRFPRVPLPFKLPQTVPHPPFNYLKAVQYLQHLPPPATPAPWRP